MNYIQYSLNKLAEEAAEVAQQALKQAQFGADRTQPPKGGQTFTSNRDRLRSEMLDLRARFCVLEVLLQVDPITDAQAWEFMLTQLPGRWEKYAQLARDQGNLRGSISDPYGRDELPRDDRGFLTGRPSLIDQKDIIRRAAERGLAMAQGHGRVTVERPVNDFIDVFQHILDEVQRL